MELYYNGNLIASKTFTRKPVSTTGAVTIGSTRANSEPFNGLIGEVRIFRKALSDAQIQVLYNLFRGELRKPPSI
jgi:hypothetical protein